MGWSGQVLPEKLLKDYVEEVSLACGFQGSDRRLGWNWR